MHIQSLISSFFKSKTYCICKTIHSYSLKSETTLPFYYLFCRNFKQQKKKRKTIVFKTNIHATEPEEFACN